jgi:hypothetical protein
MRRRKVLVVLAVGLVALSAFVAWPRPIRVSRANYHGITMGMSRAEVIAIFGPVGNCRTEPLFLPLKDMAADEAVLREYDALQLPTSTLEWFSDEGEILVTFGPEATVCSKRFWPVRPLSAIERLKRQWHRWFP